jgi:hypothetical protein
MVTQITLLHQDIYILMHIINVNYKHQPYQH